MLNVGEKKKRRLVKKKKRGSLSLKNDTFSFLVSRAGKKKEGPVARLGFGLILARTYYKMCKNIANITLFPRLGSVAIPVVQPAFFIDSNYL